MPTDKRVEIKFESTVETSVIEPTPIFDGLMENWTQFYADDVLARRVEADINGNSGKEETDGPATPVGHADDSTGAPREGNAVAE